MRAAILVISGLELAVIPPTRVEQLRLRST